MASRPNLISGLAGSIRDLFNPASKPVRTKTDKPNSRDIQPFYRFEDPIDKRLNALADYYYREGS